MFYIHISWIVVQIVQRSYKGSNNLGQGVLQRFVGKDVTATDYDSSGYNGGPISQGSDYCDFSKQCCWKDSSTGGLKWQSAFGAPESAKLKNIFATTTAPSGNWLVAAAETSATDSATFVSCSITCTTGPITLSLRHWATKNVVIQVCTQADGSNSSQDCQSVPSVSPGPYTVILPAVTSLSDLVIVASGFSDSQGSVAMIDDITVNANICPTTTTSTTTTTTTLAITTVEPACTKVQCNFESRSQCSYTDAKLTGEVSGVTQQWQVVSGIYMNRLTGISKIGEGKYYIATYLHRNDAAALVTNVNFDQDRVVRFLAYRAIEDVDLQMCCDNVQSCIHKMGKSVQISDFRNWRTISVTCPAGTTKVILYAQNSGRNAQNSGRNEGAVGVDNIQLLIPSGSSPDSATTPAC